METQALLRIKKTCGYGKSIVSPILKYIAAGGGEIFASLVRVCGWRERLANNFLVPSAFL